MWGFYLLWLVIGTTITIVAFAILCSEDETTKNDWKLFGFMAPIALLPWLCIIFGEWVVLEEKYVTPEYVEFHKGHIFYYHGITPGANPNLILKSYEDQFGKAYNGEQIKITKWQKEFLFFTMLTGYEHTVVEKESSNEQ